MKKTILFLALAIFTSGIYAQNPERSHDLIAPASTDTLVATGDFYKDGYFWMMKGAGNGDVIYNTCSEIVDNLDTSEWARQAVRECSLLLMDRKRWPDRMIWHGREAKGWIRYWWSKTLKRLGVIKQHLRRPQKDVTRDPFKALYCAAKFLEMDHIIESVTVPWRLRRVGMQRWRRKLIKDNRPQWRQRLDYYEDLAGVMNYEKKFP